MSFHFGIICFSFLALANAMVTTNVTTKDCRIQSCGDITWTPGCVEGPTVVGMDKTCVCPGAPCPTCCHYGCSISGGWLCLVGGNCQLGVCPAEPGCNDAGQCHTVFGKDKLGICVPTNKDGWNIKHKDLIDFSAGMKTGLCKSEDKEPCCGCFKMAKCEDSKCVSKRRFHRECIKNGDPIKPYLYNTGRMCKARKDCFCYQNCKRNRKCKKAGGKCLGTNPGPGYKVMGPCDKKKKCNCYVPILVVA